jgi:hypothetical protein
MNSLQQYFKQVDPEFGYVVVAFLFACMIWASPILFLRDNVLGKVVMVSAIIVLTMYHRIAGIIALMIAISFMQSQQTHGQKEGFSMKLDSPMMHPLLGSAAIAPSAIQFGSAAEFREKYCMNGVAAAGDQLPGFQYMLSPALFDKSNDGKLQLKLEAIKQMNISSMNAANSCKPDPANSTNYVSIASMCDPGCKWTTNQTTNPTDAPAKEGFTPALRPHIRSGRRMMTDSVDALKSGVSRLKRQLF